LALFLSAVFLPYKAGKKGGQLKISCYTCGMKTIEDFLDKYPTIESANYDEGNEVLDRLFNEVYDAHLEVIKKLNETPNAQLTPLEVKLLVFDTHDVEDFQEPELDNDPFYDEVSDEVYEPTQEEIDGENSFLSDLEYEDEILELLDEKDKLQDLDYSTLARILTKANKKHTYKELHEMPLEQLVNTLKAEL
jgi:hypothetical protein